MVTFTMAKPLSLSTRQHTSLPPSEPFNYQQAFRSELMAIDDAINARLARQKQLLATCYPQPQLTKAIDTLADAIAWPHGGKRIRPVLALLFANGYSNEDNTSKAIHTACALEYIHTYSLVHDDLPCMDNDSLRRGKATVHCQFDEATAVLIGDNLLAEAFEMASQPNSGLSANQQLAIINILSSHAGTAGLIAGQYLDLNTVNNNIGIDGAQAIHQGKTAALISASLQCGTIIAGQPSSIVIQAGELGRTWGALFQLVDDLLDTTATADELGKTPGKDAKQAKNSMVNMMSRNELIDACTMQYEKGIAQLNGLPLTPLAKLRIQELLSFTHNRTH